MLLNVFLSGYLTGLLVCAIIWFIYNISDYNGV